MRFLTTRRALLLAAGLALGTALSGPGFAADPVTLSFLVDNAPNTVAWANQLKTDFEAANPDIKIDIEQRPGGADGDNLSTIIVRWGPETLTDDTATTTTTDSLNLGDFHTAIDKTVTLTDRKGTQRDLTDDEIERAIAEIQSTIQKYRR